MRKSHEDHVEWIEKRVELSIKDKNNIWGKYVEIFERRNLLTHTSGKVSPQYLAKCKAAGFDVSSVSLGSKLSVSENYLREAVVLLTEFGIKLIQVVWRKILPSEIAEAVESLDGAAFNLIERRRYGTAASILKFGLEEVKEKGPDLVRKRMIVNYANAVKLDGDLDGALKIIDKEDWSASQLKFRVCVAAVKNDVDAVSSLMKLSVESNELTLDNFKEWPVFMSLRSDQVFAQKFKDVFGVELLSDRSATGLANLGERSTAVDSEADG